MGRELRHAGGLGSSGDQAMSEIVLRTYTVIGFAAILVLIALTMQG